MAVSKILNDNNKNNYSFGKLVLHKDGSIWLITKNQGIFTIVGSHQAHPALLHFAAALTGDFRLPADKTNFVYCDHLGQNWVGTDAGMILIRKKGSSFTATNVFSQRSSSPIGFISATEDAKHDRILFATSKGYLIAFNEVSANCVKQQLISAGQINGVCLSRKRPVIYCSTSLGTLLTLSLSDWHLIQTATIDAGPILSVYEDHKGLVWLEPEELGAIKFDPTTGAVKHFTQRNDSNFSNGSEYYNVFEDVKGRLWVNMKGYGFGYYDTETDKINYFHNSPDIKEHYFSNLVNCQYFDPAGILWLSSDDRGLDKVIFEENDFHQKTIVPNSIIKSENEVRAVYEDHEKRLWVSTKQGNLYITKDGKPVKNLFDQVPSAPNIGIYTILEDHLGCIWLGTKSNGLYRADPVNNERSHYKVTHYLADRNANLGLGSNVVYSLLEDYKGRIWVASYDNGLTIISRQKDGYVFYNVKKSLKNYPKGLYHKIRNIAFDAKGNLWIATINGLLVADINHNNPDDLNFKTYNKIPGDSSSLGTNDIQFIFRDTKNTMWLATSGGGLSMAIGNYPTDQLKFRTYTMRDGLPNDYILNCSEDSKHNLWMATQKGISEFVADRSHFKNFDSYDGLPKNGFSESSCTRLSNGHLVFGAVSGYVSFNPDSIIDHKIEANMALTGFMVNSENFIADGSSNATLTSDINKTNNITLQYNQNLIEIGYSMLDYRSSNKNVYAYRLKGFDMNWTIDNKNLRRATYSHLPPGKYLFEVKSLNNELYFHAPVKRLAITILPPVWDTWWAYLIYVCIGLLLIRLIRRNAITMLKLKERIAGEKQLTELKLSFFTNISHELRTPLTLILNPIEDILRREKLSSKGIAHAQVIQKNAKRMVGFVNQLLDLRKLQNGKTVLNISEIEIGSFINDIACCFSEIAIEKNISLKIVSNPKKLFAWIDGEKLEIVIYNLLANAFKFSEHDTLITVTIDQDIANRRFSIRVSDEGPGVPVAKLNDIFELYYEGGDALTENPMNGTGIGLALAKEIVELHLGSIKAVNNPLAGLTIELCLHLGKGYFKNTTSSFVEYAKSAKNENCLFEEKIDEPSFNNVIHDSDIPLILLVEDNYDLRKFMAGQLSDYYRVVEADNGQIGWDKALKLQPDLIISDIMMPKMDGIQLLDKLKNEAETSHIPVVLLSAKSAIESQIQGLRYGADYYITKPFNNDLILALTGNLLKQRKHLFEKLIAGNCIMDLNPSQIVITSKDEEFLKKIIKIVEDGMIDTDFNIESVAESIGMSRSAFYRKIKGLTSLTPVEFIREMRLKRSLQFLDAGENDIAQIAYSVGFSDPKYFSNCFKKYYEISPSEYLKSKKLTLQQSI
ncbi:two-component regulator propeller domain-containing protein [Mucilaginibacter sp. L196]|uniref:two-component regulator propeller domain-containing protein n=1 Tax=Mucilaginibacter sp. L196 TaxID=1641870 RepID=UPI0020B1259A|nr:two-component regulator propeller domain-containing protein [Mucilaginibacter sp. L196]